MANGLTNTQVLLNAYIKQASSKVFVALVNLAEYYKFMVNENKELVRHIFEANVRDYQGNIALNKDIHDTLENPASENFWWLNNGATIIASNATHVIAVNVELCFRRPDRGFGFRVFEFFLQFGNFSGGRSLFFGRLQLPLL